MKARVVMVGLALVPLVTGCGGGGGTLTMGDAGRAVSAEHPQHGHPDEQVDTEHRDQGEHDRPRDDAFGLADLLAQRRDAGVAGEGEEEQPRRLQHAIPVELPAQHPGGVERHTVLPRQHGGHHHPEQRAQDQRDDDPRGGHRPLHPGDVQSGDQDDGQDRGHPFRTGRQVGTDGHGHRRARRGLAHDEAPPREIAPDPAQPLPPVDVGAAGGGIAGRQCRR